MIRDLFLVLRDLTVELVGEVVDRGVHVALGGLGMDRCAADVDGRLRLMDKLLYGQDAVDARHIVEMTFQLLEAGRNVVAQRVRDVDVMPGYRQIPGILPCWPFRGRGRLRMSHPQRFPPLRKPANQPASLLRFRSLDDGMLNASRYFAIVRRATWIPSFERMRA